MTPDAIVEGGLPARLPAPGGRRRSGFAAVDAVVALSILSITLAFCLQAGVMGLRASRSAAEARAAEILGRYALSLPATSPQAGSTPRFDWQVEVAIETRNSNLSADVTLCRREFSATSRLTQRRYDWTSLSPCGRQDLVG